MSNNKENNIKLHGIITKMWNDIKTKFSSVETKYKAADTVVLNEAKKYTDDEIGKIPAGLGTSAIQIFNGQVLSFSEQKTTGAFANRTLFSEKEFYPQGSLNLGVSLEFVGSVIPAKQRLYFENFKELNENSGPSIIGVDTDPTFPGRPKGVMSLRRSNHDSDVKYQYTALKDITFSEMGNTGVKANGL